ncbi:glycerate kinase [Protaetiibacter sp. SSC-01]|uniref:glycerate kinase n=1 Tax=Protaetiibacter sp. SSC-01 TaxID=2759943 RepID=UPI00165700F7|nr:glycerate kinase [Protaetiibacter sp. SSC-01]QNO38505.1 glycerate kinase [Protaetiibacter sp. SSC-01]
MRVVLAPDSFTGSCSARDAALVIARGWRSVRPGDELLVLPQADGGVGTLDVVAEAVPDAVLHDAGEVTGADGRPAPGRWLALPDGRALVELADCVGLWRMERPDPLGASTRGLGALLGRVLDAGATRIVIGLGGSGSTEGGTGALAALGARFLDAEGRELPDGGTALARLDSIDLSALRTPPAEIELWCDVEAPLTGRRGAASVFGPQKGATPDDVRVLDAALARLASVLGGDPDAPGAGAAGGTAYGLVSAWGARVASGSAAVSALTGLDAAIPTADLVVTGEGRVDAATATGKVAGAIMRRADDAGVPVAIVAGSIDVGVASARAAVSLTELAGSADAAMTDAPRWLERAGAELAERLAPGGNVSRVPSV